MGVQLLQGRRRGTAEELQRRRTAEELHGRRCTAAGAGGVTEVKGEVQAAATAIGG